MDLYSFKDGIIVNYHLGMNMKRWSISNVQTDRCIVKSRCKQNVYKWLKTCIYIPFMFHVDISELPKIRTT